MRVADQLNENWLLATEIHKIEARIWRKAQRDNLKVVLFTSASRGDGKSTTVACLATALGLYPGRRVLAVDLDFRVPRLNSHFEVQISHGLGEVLRGECAVEEAIISTGLPSLDVALPRSEGEDPSLLLRTTVLWEMFAHFRKSYDLILIDTPALIPVADTSMLLPLADGVVLLGMAGKTTKHEFRTARELCVGMEANILGLVVGNLQEATPEYGYGYGYGYGNGHGYGYGHHRATRSPRATRAKEGWNGTRKKDVADQSPAVSVVTPVPNRAGDIGWLPLEMLDQVPPAGAFENPR